VKIQTSVFQNNNAPFFYTVNYLAYNCSEDFNVLESKFKRIVFELFNIVNIKDNIIGPCNGFVRYGSCGDFTFLMINMNLLNI